jgi:hypothetical protein
VRGRPRVEKLLVGRRDCTELAEGVLKQVEHVRCLVGDIPITGALCFVEADWPLIGGAQDGPGIEVPSGGVGCDGDEVGDPGGFEAVAQF